MDLFLGLELAHLSFNFASAFLISTNLDYRIAEKVSFFFINGLKGLSFCVGLRSRKF